jgi:hypothetical protein
MKNETFVVFLSSKFNGEVILFLQIHFEETCTLSWQFLFLCYLLITIHCQYFVHDKFKKTNLLYVLMLLLLHLSCNDFFLLSKTVHFNIIWPINFMVKLNNLIQLKNLLLKIVFSFFFSQIFTSSAVCCSSSPLFLLLLCLLFFLVTSFRASSNSSS